MTLTLMRDEVRRLLGGISTTEYSTADINISINIYYDRFILEAITASGEWQVQGEVSTANIVADQQEYVFPSDLVALDRIEVNPTGGTNTWSIAKIIDMRSYLRPLSNAATTTIAGITVRVFDDSIFFVDSPSAASTAGLKIYSRSEATVLDDSTTPTPNIVDSLHIGLVYGACLDFGIAKNLDKEQATFKSLYDEIRLELKDHYANKIPAKRTKITTRAERYE